MFSLINTQGKRNGEVKRATSEQLKAAKGVGSITWSTKTGSPLSIMGDLTPPSGEDPEVIAWRFLEEKKALYGMKNPHEDLSIKTIINGKYDTTIHFQQRYKGVLVEAYLVVDILPNGVIHGMGGEYYSELKVDITPKISAQRAKYIASQHGQKHDSSLTDLPKTPALTEPDLLIRPGEDEDYLMWHFIDSDGWEYYINAHNEVIKDAFSPIKQSFSPACGNVLQTKDLPEGARVCVHVNSGAPSGGYWAEDDLSTGTMRVKIYNANYSFSYPAPLTFSSLEISDSFTNIKGNQGVSALYYTGKAYDFYREKFGKDGYRGDGSQINVVINYRSFEGSVTTASYNESNGTISLGYGGPLGSFGAGSCDNLAGSLDTIAHEYTHAVQISSEVGELIGSGESGALAESFADMMACAVEYWVAHTVNAFEGTFDWTFEEDIKYKIIPIETRVYIPKRSLEDPGSSDPPQPDTYLGPDWSTDPTAIHNNCGVPNKMFFLLSEGGTHNGITVTGLGADSEHVLNAAKIMYLAATEKWPTNVTFALAKDRCILAAKNLDNENGTHWAYSVANAWAAVGVGGQVVGDNFEPDNDYDGASRIELGDKQTHSIIPAPEYDRMIFTLESRTGIKIETTGSSGDTEMWLYDEQRNFIEYDDDDGINQWSKIKRELDPGTYYIMIEEYGNNNEILSYNISLTECITADSYEPDNSYTAAKMMWIGTSQTRSIEPASDVDWFYFDVPYLPYPYFYYWYPRITILTTGPYDDDTQLWLLNSQIYLMAYNDNISPGKFSYISGYLPYPGRYYVAVMGKGDVIDQYKLSVNMY